jgi:hypothetical protein
MLLLIGSSSLRGGPGRLVDTRQELDAGQHASRRVKCFSDG